MCTSISRLAKILPFIVLFLRKRVDYLNCIEGKEGWKAIHCIAQNATQFVDLL